MSKARGASMARKMRRNGHKFDIKSGTFKNRPNPNKTNKGKRKPFHRFISAVMSIFRKDKEVVVPKTITTAYERRVFKDKSGNYPENAYESVLQYGGFHPGDTPKLRKIMVVKDTREVAVTKTHRVKL